MGLVIALRAVPGSGKSTYAKQLLESLKNQGKSVEIFSSDDYFYKLGNGEYQFDVTKIGLAHGECFRKFIEAMQEGTDVIIVDNTNLSAWELSPYKLGADAFGYDFKINEISASQEEAFKRQQHGVPEDIHKQMQQSFEKEDEVMPWWEKEKYEAKSTETGPEFSRIARLADRFLKIVGGN